MLTSDQYYILNMLRKSLIPQYVETSVYTDANKVESIVLRNGILLTVYKKLSDDLQKWLKDKYLTAVANAIIQEYEGNQVLKHLSDAGLNCIALKGWELLKLYPEQTMRQMADLDILVKPYKYEKIKSIMAEIGFSCESESAWKHDSFKKNKVHVEMHKRLTDDSRSIQRWERGIWDRASRIEDNVFRMSPEDFYIFHFVHLYKDFMNGSLGLRRIVDTWLLQKQPVDMSVVRNTLASFEMWKFHERMVKLSQVTMGDEPIDKDSEVLLKHAFTHGIYGSDKSYKAGRIAAMGGSLRRGKLQSKIAAVFLPYARMKAQYPVLEKCPVLLPYCWGKRIIRYARGNTKKYRYMMDYSNVGEDDYIEIKNFFEAGGV